MSGGGDSLALMLIAKAWADRHGRVLSAFTVDHCLHPESGRWTAFAGEAAARAGVAWRPLHWTGDKPKAGLPAAARRARHRLLAEAAHEVGARVLLLGHTRDDLAEAQVMRRGDAPGLGRMSDWGPSPSWPQGRGLFLLRPLLVASRGALREFLTKRGERWLDDPANDDPRFARARARRALVGGDAADSEIIPRGTTVEADGSRPWSVTPDGRIVIGRSQLRVMPQRGRFLSAALLCAAGSDEPPRGERLERLTEALEGAGLVTASLAGARITADLQTVQIGREAGERTRGGLAPIFLEPGARAVWDGRYTVTTDLRGSIEPMAGHLGRLARSDREWLKTLPPASRSALPVLVAAGGPPTLPRPFGHGPAHASCLVETRLLAAMGAFPDERALAG